MGTVSPVSDLVVEPVPAPGIGVRAEPIVVLGCLTIDPDSYRTHRRHREIADRVMAEYGYKPDVVTEIRVTETCVEVDWVWIEEVDGRRVRRDPAVRTTRYEARS